MADPQERRPDDQTLTAVVTTLIQGISIGTSSHESDAIHFIDKGYRVTTIHRGRAGLRSSPITTAEEANILRRVNRLRQKMLEESTLLATVATGWSVGWDGEAVMQHFPAPGQIETYVLSWPRPQILWRGDPVDDPDGSIAIEGYQEIWSIEELYVRNKHFGEGEEV